MLKLELGRIGWKRIDEYVILDFINAKMIKIAGKIPLEGTCF